MRCLQRRGAFPDVAPRLIDMADGAPALEDILAWPLVGVALSDDEPDPLIQILRAGGLEGRLIATIPYFAAALEIVARSDAAMLLPASIAAVATSSRLTLPGKLSDCTGTDGCVTMMFGATAIMLIGMRSLIVSYGTFEKSDGLTV